MKRIIPHVLFWSAYFFQNVLLIFFVNTTRSGHGSLLQAMENCLVLLLPKLLFTYFIFWAWPKPALEQNRHRKQVGYILLALALTLLVYRGLVVFFVDPFIYRWDSGTPFFYLLGFLVALMDVGFVAGTAVALRQYRAQSAARAREQQLLRSQLEAELRFLRSQTNPHFLFNTLNNIYALARRKSDDAPEAVLQLSKLLRFMLCESAKPLIAIADEVRVLDDYIELEKMRYNSRLTINFYREIDDPRQAIAPLLLLPFVENAFKHGASDSHLEAYIHIDLEVKNGALRLTVENSMEEGGATTSGTGIGLRNLRRQLELTYAEFNLAVGYEAGRHTASLYINLNTHEKISLPAARG
ncbi:MAG: hypothetical protein EOO16_14990 [Chitinophagaceae bacterium]|nr:MAG: hypothetical protein EOO16_14990 [Chitinophagaceae bacterium]